MAVSRETLRLVHGLRLTMLKQLGATDEAIVKAWGRAWNEIAGEWDAAVTDLVAASKDGAWPSRATVLREQRARNALKVTREALMDLAKDLPVTVTDVLPDAVAAQLDSQAAVLTSQLPARSDVVVSQLDPKQLSAIVERTSKQVTSLSLPMAARTEAAMKAALIKGVAVGDNPRKVASDMVARVHGAFEGGKARALVIARTETLDAHRTAAQRQHAANADTLDGWVWWCALDKRSCPSCWAMHGTVHGLDVQGPNDHQQGRCARVPKVKPWKDLGITAPEPVDLTPDAETVFAGLSRADQVAVMGEQRLALLNAGKVSWSDLSTKRSTDGWRDSFVPTPVTDLRARASA